MFPNFWHKDKQMGGWLEFWKANHIDAKYIEKPQKTQTKLYKASV